jgi:electron transfer flavoprotein alpha/beta subunit
MFVGRDELAPTPAFIATQPRVVEPRHTTPENIAEFFRQHVRDDAPAADHGAGVREVATGTPSPSQKNWTATLPKVSLKAMYVSLEPPEPSSMGGRVGAWPVTL